MPDPATIADAARLLRDGRLVAFPTETVYGLGGDATQPAAVDAIFQAKRRPRHNPLICHVAEPGAAELLADFDDLAAQLAAQFWPGPMTLVLPRRPGNGIAEAVSAGLDTIAIRVPSHPLATALLRAVDRPVAAPSANLSGRLSPTRAQHVRAQFGDEVAMVVDGGACPVGLESTVIGVFDGDAQILRQGALTVEMIEAALGRPVVPAAAGQPVRAPGQLASHYAPRLPIRLEALAAAPGEVLLGFGPGAPPGANLSQRGDLAEAAANLFAALHRLDRAEYTAIAVMPIPDVALGRAINDRLRRAAAPR